MGTIDDPKYAKLAKLAKDGREVTLWGYQTRREIPDWVFSQIHTLLNDIIKDGNTYPIEEELDVAGFEAYYCPHFIAVLFDGHVADVQQGPLLGENSVMGAFYIKPNYVGRSSHICNGGFIVKPEFRGLGCGDFMGESYVEWAPRLGFKSSIFNLVYANNPGSYRIWDKLGFTRIGVIPQAGRLRDSPELVDAIIFNKVF